MNFEIFTERARGFVQVSQDLAQRESHQRLMPEHLLKVLLCDEEGLCANLMHAAGGDAHQAEQAVDLALSKLPKVEGSGASSVFLAPETGRVLSVAEDVARKAGDSFVTVERLFLSLVLATGAEVGKILTAAGLTPQSLNP
jgi:ATP-dependent Clp protease ATP-binding subunit ClpB